MRIRRKTKDCLNCGLGLSEIYNYCPRCGQENHVKMVSFGQLFRDFIVNYFSFDTKFFRSIKPFILKPGQLTVLFIEGKRASYVNPLRLYIILSVVFFFLSTLLVQQAIETGSIREGAVQNISGANTAERREAAELGIGKFRDILADETLSNQQVLDSLKNVGVSLTVKFESYTGELVFNQLRKVARQDFDVFMAYVMQNMPIMMFFLLPFYAIVLKLLYFRNNILYVKHLIYGLHIHCFTFFLISLLLLLYLVTEPESILVSYVEMLVYGLLIVYIYISMLHVYRQKWLKTLIKFFLLGFVYFFMLLVFGISEAFISFLIF